MAEIKQFQNSAEIVLFHFYFKCADIQFEAFRRTAQFLCISFPFPLSCSWEEDPLKSSYGVWESVSQNRFCAFFTEIWLPVTRILTISLNNQPINTITWTAQFCIVVYTFCMLRSTPSGYVCSIHTAVADPKTFKRRSGDDVSCSPVVGYRKCT